MTHQQIPTQFPITDVFAPRYGTDHSTRPMIMVVHPSDIGFILGKNGNTIKTIEDEVGVIITFVPYTQTYPEIPPHFTVVGNPPATMNAFTRMTSLANESLRRQWAKSAKTSEVTNTLKIKRDDMKMVIGKGGHTIQSINKRYNVRSFTRVDKDHPKDTSVIDIIGYGPDVAAAKKHIGNIIIESMRRRGVMTDIMEQSNEMYTILKKQEDDAMVEKLTLLFFDRSLSAQKEMSELRQMLEQTDKPLLKRVDEAIDAKISAGRGTI